MNCLEGSSLWSRLNVNGVRHEVQAPDDTPLLYVLRNDLQLDRSAVRLRTRAVRSLCRSDRWQGSAFLRYACFRRRWRPGNHHARRSARAGGQSKRASRQRKRKARFIPVQQAWIEEQTPQCGFCQNGMMIKATELLESNPNPTTGANQRGLHHVWAVAESLPLRNLRRHY